MDGRRVVVAANRGPVSFERDERTGRVVPRRGSGGLVTALEGVLARTGGLWVAAAMTDEDRRVAARGAVRIDGESGGPTYHVRYLSLRPDAYSGYYNGISNGVLWFLHHYLWGMGEEPTFDHMTRSSWAAYREVNEAFADALVAEFAGDLRPTYLVQDYHLSLVPAAIRRRLPDARIGHFLHIPFAGSSYFRLLPQGMRRELLAGLLGADVLGFQSEAWAENFLQSCRDLLPGAAPDLRRHHVRWEGRTVRARVYPVGIDGEALDRQVEAPEVAQAAERLRAMAGGARLVMRADRFEPTKNILRGFRAFGRFLAVRSEWRRRVVFIALLNPSRQDLPQYRSYVSACLETADRINEELADATWKPIHVIVQQDFSLVLAGYTMYDVLLVNSTYDGMNLVSKEGPRLNRNDGVLVLSENAGAVEELGRHAIVVNPFDLEQQAEAIGAALDMEPARRRRRAASLRRAAGLSSPERWVAAQLAELGG